MAAACKKVNFDETQCVEAVRARLNGGNNSDLSKADVCSDIFCKADSFNNVCTKCKGNGLILFFWAKLILAPFRGLRLLPQ